MKKLINLTKLNSADIFIFHTKGFSPISIAIRSLTQSYWNHTGMYIKELTVEERIKYRVGYSGKGYIVEALGNGVVVNKIDNYWSNNSYDIKVVRVKESIYNDNSTYLIAMAISQMLMLSYVGYKYDWWGVIWLAIKYYIKGSLREVKINWLQEREKFFCSEAICSAFYNSTLNSGNIFKGEKYKDADCGNVTPKDIGKTRNVEYIDSTNEDLKDTF